MRKRQGSKVPWKDTSGVPIYFDPVYEAPNLPKKISSVMQNALTLEALKEHQKSVEKMKNDGPRFLA